jgi:hypothetical protein
VITIVITIVVCIFPLVIKFHYGNNIQKLYRREDEFMAKYGSLVEGLNVHRHGSKVLIFLWMEKLRILWFVSMLVFM